MSKKINEIMTLFYVALLVLLAAMFYLIGSSMASAQGRDSALGIGYGSADSQSASQSASQAGSFSSIEQNYYNSGRSEVAYSGRYEVTNTPSVSAPGQITAHVCALGASGGASGAGWGISIGGTYTDENCVLLMEANALRVVGGNTLAIAHMARDPQMCVTLRSQGFIASNSPCTANEKRAAARASSAPPATRPVTRPGSAKPALKVRCDKRDGKTVPVVTQAVMDAYSSKEIKAACNG